MNRTLITLITFIALIIGTGCATCPKQEMRRPNIDTSFEVPMEEEKPKKEAPKKGATIVQITADETNAETWTESERRTKMALMTGNQDDVLVRPENGFECTTSWVCNEMRGTCYCTAGSSPSKKLANIVSSYPSAE